MRTIVIPSGTTEINSLLEQARQEDVLVKAADGTEFILTAVEAFDREIARTRQNAKLMALLDERGNQTRTVSLDEVKRQLGFSD